MTIHFITAAYEQQVAFALSQAAGPSAALSRHLAQLREVRDRALADLEQREDEADVPRRRLTRQEHLEGLADSGCDTWAEHRGDR